MTAKVKALGLSSGGLDSILAGLVLRSQGIKVAWISFETPFFSADNARKASELTGIPLKVRNITPTYLKMLIKPKCGYGKGMNPCLDCHALMFRIAGGMMQAQGYDFLFSGEVAGQRPMSQTKQSLRYVEKNSGYDGYILRPLSALQLPETIPEKTGLVDRKLLLDISGRSRKVQMQLAEEFKVKDYPSPAGGCLLTEKVFATRLKDLFKYNPGFKEAELHLLRYGRHLRLNAQTKIIVGRHQEDNAAILEYIPEGALIKMQHIPGPVVVCPPSDSETLQQAAAICVYYSKAPSDTGSDVLVKNSNSSMQVINVKPMQRQAVQALMI